MDTKIYDLIIVGAGPAGLSASIYASRYKTEHLLFGHEIGGQILDAWDVENYPGFESISGKELMGKFRIQAEKLGGKIIQDGIVKAEKDGENFCVTADNGEKYFSQSLIFALGMKAKKADISGEDKFIGKGVSYCATCDAMFFKNKEVAVIGGGNSAVVSALHLAEFASKVTLLYRGEKFKYDPAWQDKVDRNPKIEGICCAVVKEIIGDSKVEKIIYDYKGEKKELSVQGVFIEIGTVPGVTVAKDLGVKTDEQDYIVVDAEQQTNLKNVFAAGDATTGSNKFRQVITAAAEGASAASSVYKKIKLAK